MKQICLGVFFLFLLAGSVQSYNILLNFNSPEKVDFSNYILTLKVNNEIKTDKLLFSGYSLELLPSNYTLTAMLDSSSTPAVDYLGSKSLVVAESGTIDLFVIPVGHVQGSVTDADGNLAGGARISINCFSGSGGTYLGETDQTGFFSFSNLPEGSCTLIASDTKNAAKLDLVVKMGKVTTVEMSLKQKLVQKNLWWKYLAYSLVIIVMVSFLALVVISLVKRKLWVEKDLKTEALIKEKNLSTQILAILPTLSDKERLVVDFLLRHSNSSPQAKVRHGTHLPRTTLSRIVEGLERKKVLTINKEGKAVIFTLTEFFLGKSDKREE